MKLKDVVPLVKETFQEWSEDRASRLAAALSYYTVFSIAPLFVLLIGIAGLVVSQSAVQGQILAQVEQMVGSGARDIVESMISETGFQSAGIIATIIGIVTLLIGASGVFTQLHDALNTIWEVQLDPDQGIRNVIRKRIWSFIMILGIGLLLLLSLLVSAVLPAINEFAAGLLPGSNILWQVLNFVVSFAIVTLLFALLFKYLPDARIAWRDVWLGAAVTALLFTIGKWLIGLYLGTSGATSVYGAAGSLVAILIFVYYSAQILFLGAEFTQVYARRYGEGIEPEEGAIRLTEMERAQQGMPHRETAQRAAREQGAPQRGETERGAAGRGEAIPVTGRVEPAEESPVKERVLYAPPTWRPRPDEDALKPPTPSMLAVSGILVALLGFISGLVVRRGDNSKS